MYWILTITKGSMLLDAACVSVDAAGTLTYQKCFVSLLLLEAILKYVLPDKIKPVNLKNLESWRRPSREIVSLPAPRPSDTAVIHVCWDSGDQGLDFSFYTKGCQPVTNRSGGAGGGKVKNEIQVGLIGERKNKYAGNL